MISAVEALEKLKDGNRRFTTNSMKPTALTDDIQREELVGGQAPFAIILGCADSRVPAELVFDQGLGDLFVIRVAGNIASPSQIGSIEYAAGHLGTRLIVVLGHTGCGAVQATLSEMAQPPAERSPNLSAIVDRIRPALESLWSERGSKEPGDLLADAVRANVQASAAQLREGSTILENLMDNDGLLVVGAEYSLATGAVDFFNN